MHRLVVASLAITLSLLLQACGARNSSVLPPGSASAPSPASSDVPSGGATPASIKSIQHIIVIIQENRTLNNLFMNFPGARTATSATTSAGAVIPLAPVGLEYPLDIDHSRYNFLRQYDEGRLRFDLGAPAGRPRFPYAYVPRSETAPYWNLASQYVLGDETFQSNGGPSYPAHQYLIAGQTVVSQPGFGLVFPDGNPNQDNTGKPTVNAWGCDDAAGTWVPVLRNGVQQNTGLFPCYDYKTLADELDAANLSWRYYAPRVLGSDFGGVWAAYDPIRHIRYGTDWTKIISPETQILTDASRSLPSVTYIVPTAKNSDHPGPPTANGPQWVANVVNAIGRSSNWSTSAIFIIWDDWGGWYDPVVPPQLDNMGLGFRVPLIVVSPYARKGYVSHRQHEFGSILRFIETRYGLGVMGASDRRADNLLDCFDFTQPPRSFTPVPTTLTAKYFETQSQWGGPPDDD